MKRLGLNEDERKLDVCKALLGEPADAVVGELLSTISILRLEVGGHLAAVKTAVERERAAVVKFLYMRGTKSDSKMIERGEHREGE